MKKLILLFFFTASVSFSQWSIQSSNTNLSINSVCFVNANTGYAVGNNARFFRTTNGGQNWGSAIIPGLSFNLEVITAREAGSAVATGRFSIFTTTNSGMNWTQTDFNPSYRIRDLFEHQNGKLYATAYEYNNTEDTIVSARILLSTNYGNTWGEVASIAIDESGTCTCGRKPKKPKLIMFDDNNGYLATIKGIFKTTNSWNTFLQVSDQAAWVIDAAVPTLIYAGVTNGNYLEVIKSTNQGANWVLVSFIPNGLGAKGFSEMRVLPTVNKIFLTVSSTDAGSDFLQQDSSIYATWDNGLSWHYQSIPIPNTNLFSMDFIDSNTGWAVGSGGTILKTTNGGGSPIGIHLISGNVPEEFSLWQNYPNPFNPVTNIKYQIKNNSFVSIKIFGVLGEEVAAIVNRQHTPGTYEVNWDASGYPSGIYFYRMESGDFTETKKMALIK